MTERATCESCGRIARLHSLDGCLSPCPRPVPVRWCIACIAAAIALGYDDDQGTLVGSES
jgi:hypothetical protein